MRVPGPLHPHSYIACHLPGAPSPSLMHGMSHRAHAHTEHLDTQAVRVDGGRDGLGGRAWWAPVVTTKGPAHVSWHSQTPAPGGGRKGSWCFSKAKHKASGAEVGSGTSQSEPNTLLGVWGLPPRLQQTVVAADLPEGSAPTPWSVPRAEVQQLPQVLGLHPTTPSSAQVFAGSGVPRWRLDHPRLPRAQTLNGCTTHTLQLVP